MPLGGGGWTEIRPYNFQSQKLMHTIQSENFNGKNSLLHQFSTPAVNPNNYLFFFEKAF